jgi:elongation factor Ts
MELQMKITAAMIKDLRQKTHAGMNECHKALQQTEGNIEKSIVLLREKGIIKAAQKQGRVTSEGITNIVFAGNDAFLYEINSETDFVSKNEHFQQLVKVIGEIILQNKLSNTKDLLAFNYQNKTVQELLLAKTFVLGENITLKRILKVTKKSQESFGIYKHQGGRISVLVVFKNDCPSISEEIAMHIAASKPQFLTLDQVDPIFLAEEKKILHKQTSKELFDKPAQMIEKIVENRLGKMLKEICLLEQPFIKNSDQKVKDYLKNNNTDLVSYVRWEMGN